MKSVQLFWALLVALPDILKLIENLQKEAEKVETDRKVKQDIQIINQAFEKQDAEALRILFNS